MSTRASTSETDRHDAPTSRGVVLMMCVFALAGQIAALRLIDVEPYAVYQHYKPLADVLALRRGAAAILMLQALAVTVIAWRLRARLQRLLRATLTWRVLVVLSGAALGVLAVPTLNASRFAGELLLAGAVAMVSAANLLVVALLWPASWLARSSRWIDARVTLAPGDDRRRLWDRALPWTIAVWVLLASAIASDVVMERVPHIDDSVSYYFQAKYHAAGRLYLPPPPDAEAFHVDEVIIEADKWYGYGSPGWPMLLAAGVFAGVPWLVNPLLGGALIVVGHALVRRRTDRATANVAILLLAFSPWLLFMSAEFMPHPLTALLVLLAALAFDHACERHQGWVGWTLVAGVAVGGLALTRPVEAIFVVAAIGCTAWVDRRFARALPLGLAAGAIAVAVGGWILPFNAALTGRATYTPQMAWTDRRWGPGVDRLGFGPDIGIPAWRNIDPLPGHGVADVLLNLNKNAFMANADLFGWTAGSLMLCCLAVGLGRWRRSDGLMIALVTIFIAGYSGYWFSGGPDLGPRYWYPLIVPLAALSARGLQMLTARLSESGALDHAGPRAAATVMVASLAAGMTVLPWRAVTKHYRYRDVGGGVRDLATAAGFAHGSLIFVRGEARSDYQNAFNLNPPTLSDADSIYAHDAGPAQRERVVARFPDRPIWVIGPDDSGPRGAFVVLAGPLAPGTVPR